MGWCSWCLGCSIKYYCLMRSFVPLLGSLSNKCTLYTSYLSYLDGIFGVLDGVFEMAYFVFGMVYLRWIIWCLELLLGTGPAQRYVDWPKFSSMRTCRIDLSLKHMLICLKSNVSKYWHWDICQPVYNTKNSNKTKAC